MGNGEDDTLRKILGSEFYSCPSRHSFGNDENEGDNGLMNNKRRHLALEEMTHGKIANL